MFNSQDSQPLQKEGMNAPKKKGKKPLPFTKPAGAPTAKQSIGQRLMGKC